MALAFLVLATLACNAPWYADTAVEPTALPPLIGTTPNSQGTPISQVGAGTATPGLAPTTTAAPQLIALQDMNLRQGPSTQYPVVGALPKDQNALIVGQNPEGTWWKIACPPGATGAECWISGGAQFTTASNAAAVPLAVVPPTPTAPPAPPTAAPSPLTAPTLFYLAGGDVWQVGLQLGGSNDVSRTADPQKLTSLGTYHALLGSPRRPSPAPANGGWKQPNPRPVRSVRPPTAKLGQHQYFARPAHRIRQCRPHFWHGRMVPQQPKNRLHQQLCLP